MIQILSVILLLHIPLAGRAATLHVDLEPRFGGAPLVVGSAEHATASGQVVTVTRVDLLLSRAALRRADGTWLEAPGWTAFVGAGSGRTRFALPGLPPGEYDALRIDLGLPPELNHGDPAAHPPGHPLHPLVNGLHWDWKGGYVFLALEGRWRDPDTDSPARGFSYHVATEAYRTTLEFPLGLVLGGEHDAAHLRLGLDVAVLLGAEPITPATATTHSRAGDPVAERLGTVLGPAVSILGLGPLAPVVEVAGGLGTPRRRVRLNPDATLVPFVVPPGFPAPPLPAENPLTREGIELGRQLFHDGRLSINGSQSCASCHIASAGFSDPRDRSPGAEGQLGRRHSMPLHNLAWKERFFWDGRAEFLRQQVLMPIVDPLEMNEKLGNVVAKLQADPATVDAFEAAFGTREVDTDLLARALEQFLLTIVASGAKVDRVLAGTDTFTAEEQLGFELFHAESDPRLGVRGADCFHCHGGFDFRSVPFANNGLDATHDRDRGLAETTREPGDTGKFAVPSLRNVERTAPYMHDGRFGTLEEVIDHYDHGVQPSATLDPNLAKHGPRGLALTPEEKRALVAFLKTLGE